MTKTKRIVDYELILKKIKGTLSPEEAAFLQQWLEEDERNLNYYRQAVDFHKNGSSFDQIPPQVDVAWDTFRKNTYEKKKTSNKRIGYRWVSAAAVLLLAVAAWYTLDIPEETPQKPLAVTNKIEPGKSEAVLVLGDGTQHELAAGRTLQLQTEGVAIASEGETLEYKVETREPESEVTTNTLITPKGGEFYLELADGTKVWLNAATTLRYPTRFVGNRRVVQLEGEAYLEVAKNEESPFYVVSAGHTVKVLGTQFNISSYAEDTQVKTTLVEGKVSVYPKGRESEAATLLPNQQSIMDKKDGTIIQQTVDASRFTAWKSGSFYFQDEPLHEIMKVLARWYDLNVFYDNYSYRNVRFTGGFKRYEDFEKVRNLIEKTEEVKLKIKGNAVIVK